MRAGREQFSSRHIYRDLILVGSLTSFATVWGERKRRKKNIKSYRKRTILTLKQQKLRQKEKDFQSPLTSYATRTYSPEKLINIYKYPIDLALSMSPL